MDKHISSSGPPSVIVLMPTYNHERFITQAIESVLIQVTTFDVYLYISDDASTDNTYKIAHSFHDRNRVKINLTLNEINVGAVMNGAKLRNEAINSGCKYIAILEGDDYWTDPAKLQKQVDYLEQNLHVSICLHNGNIEENGIIIGKSRGDSFQKYSLRNVIRSKVLAPTASYVFRNIVQFPPWLQKVYGGDSALLFLLAQVGEIHYLPDVMCVYRMHQASVEGYYRNNPLDKASRDIKDCKIYLGLVANEHKVIILKRIVWIYFYRIIKGVKIGQINTILSDFYYLVNYSTRLVLLKVSK